MRIRSGFGLVLILSSLGSGYAQGGQQGDAPRVAVVDRLQLRSSAVGKDGVLPTEFTGDGSSISPPLEWNKGPEGTKGYAVIMHHIDPQGVAKWYWTLYDIPATTQSLPKGVKNIGTFGTNGINGRFEYAPPHSKGPGKKVYIITINALSGPPSFPHPEPRVDREQLLAAMKGLILTSSELKVNYTRSEE